MLVERDRELERLRDEVEWLKTKVQAAGSERSN
jgi:hypothetical protein